MLKLLSCVRNCFRPRSILQAEILALPDQLLILQRSSRGHKLRLTRTDRVFWVGSTGCETIGGRDYSSSARNCHRLALQGFAAIFAVS